MADRSLQLLGPPPVKLDDKYIAVNSRKALALLAHLTVTAESRSPDSLATLVIFAGITAQAPNSPSGHLAS